MKTLPQYINEYLIKKKIDKVKDNYKYTPHTKDELISNIKELLNKGETDLNCIDVSNITNMTDLFSDLYFSNKTFDVSNWDVSNVKYMRGLFFRCYNLICDLSNWNTSKVEDMGQMFYHCKNFDCDLSKWDVSNVKDIAYMFTRCENFTGKGLENWDVSNVKDMNRTFYGCNSLKNKPSWYK